MIDVKSASFLIGLISLFCSYVLLVSISGAFRAWVAYKMGDLTAYEEGFMSLNPFVHIDASGIISFFLMYYMGIFFGWGRYVPVNPSHISSKIKQACTLLAAPCIEFSMAILGIIFLISMFDGQILPLSQYMVLTRNMSHLFIAHMYPDASSVVVVLGFIIISFVYLATLLGVFSFIIEGCYLAAIFSSSGGESQRPFLQWAHPFKTLLIPFLLIFFFSESLRFIATSMIVYIGYAITHVIGLI